VITPEHIQIALKDEAGDVRELAAYAHRKLMAGDNIFKELWNRLVHVKSHKRGGVEVAAYDRSMPDLK